MFLSVAYLEQGAGDEEIKPYIHIFFLIHYPKYVILIVYLQDLKW